MANIAHVITASPNDILGVHILILHKSEFFDEVKTCSTILPDLSDSIKNLKNLIIKEIVPVRWAKALLPSLTA